MIGNMDNKILKIGEPIESPTMVFELVLSDFFVYINPKNYDLEIEGIDPVRYFITSGDAVEKAKVLESDFWKHAGNTRRLVLDILVKKGYSLSDATQLCKNQNERPQEFEKIMEYESLIWKSAGQSRKLLQALILAKGSNCFLETEWDDHRLYVLSKNPRK